MNSHQQEPLLQTREAAKVKVRGSTGCGGRKGGRVELLAAYGPKHVVEGIQGHVRLDPKSLLEDSGLTHWASQCPDSEPPLIKAGDLISQQNACPVSHRSTEAVIQLNRRAQYPVCFPQGEQALLDTAYFPGDFRPPGSLHSYPAG